MRWLRTWLPALAAAWLCACAQPAAPATPTPDPNIAPLVDPTQMQSIMDQLQQLERMLNATAQPLLGTVVPESPEPTETPEPAEPAAAVEPPLAPQQVSAAAVFPTRTPRPLLASDAQPCQPGQIKANRSSKIFHIPGGGSYARTVNNVICYDTESDAEAAGYRKARN
jgi:hypothetical protein